MTLAIEAGTRNPRALLAPDELMAVTATVASDNDSMGWAMAERVVLEALKFVAAGAATTKGIAPSRVVDEAWHALILHTAVYADLCVRLGGEFVHHYPELPDTSRYDPAIHERTLVAIRATGYEPDLELWHSPQRGITEVSAKCQHAPNCTIRPMPKPEWP